MFRSKVLYTQGDAHARHTIYIYTYNRYYHSLPSCAPYNNITYYKYIIYKYGVKSKKNSTVSAPTKNCTTSSSTLLATHDRGDEKGVLSDRLYGTWLLVVGRAQRFPIANPGRANKNALHDIIIHRCIEAFFDFCR